MNSVIEDSIERIPESGCWLWTRRKLSEGYGWFIRQKAHRFVYETLIEKIPKGQVLLHACDVRCCVNPAHLSVGTQSDNAYDSVRKRRHWQVKKTHCAQGHEYTPENTYYYPDGRRWCKTCIVIHNNRYKQ